MIFRRRNLAHDIERDIRDHIEGETRENIERGMAPDEARAAALRRFGNPLRVAEDTRAVWSWVWLDRLRQDTRYALRSLRRNPLFAAVAILTLALGIGLNTAVFSVVSAVLIKPLPYPHPGRIVWLANYNSRFHFEASSAPDFIDWRDQTRSFEAVAGYGTVDSTVQDGDRSSKHSFVYTTPEFWSISGAHAVLGRLFSADDRGVVVLTWRTYEDEFRANRGVLGRVIQVDGRPETIIGVLPRDFRFLPPNDMAGGMSGEAEAFVPNIVSPEQRTRGRSLLIMFVVARLKAGVTVAHARAELAALQGRIARENPSLRGFYSAAQLRVAPLQEKLVGESRRALLILLAAVGFVLLIACANLGNLLLARASARQREIAIRAAIGAGRNRLLRQFLVEGIALALLGGAAGVALARAADALLVRLGPAAVPRLGELSIDWRVLSFALAVSILSGAVFGLAPVLSLSTGSLASVLKSGGRGAAAASGGLRLRRILVAAELALAVVLLTGAGLMLKSFARMYAHPATFEPEKIGYMKVFLSGPAYRDRGAMFSYVRTLLERTSRVPGVEAAAITSQAGSGAVDIENPPQFPDGQAPRVFYRTTSSAYPRILGIPILQGSWPTGDEPAPTVAVNQAFARTVFGDGDPIGRRVRAFGNGGYMTISGVVGDLKLSRLDADPEPEVLIPYQLIPFNGLRRMDVLVKTAAHVTAVLPQIRRVVERIDPSQPPYGVMTLEAGLAASIAPRRFNLVLLGTFSGSAVLLALIGIYGVISYSVAQRTQEIGVRMALGARRGEIVRMVAVQGFAVALAGIASGAAAALALTRVMTSLLFEVRPNDPATFATVAFALLATSLLACSVPALRAARVDPLTALRYE
jgi:putative ABC transport system permease protein